MITKQSTSKDSVDEISTKMMRAGEALYGVIKMIKYNKIPAYFRHRYLLSDLGWISMTEEEGSMICTEGLPPALFFCELICTKVDAIS